MRELGDKKQAKWDGNACLRLHGGSVVGDAGDGSLSEGASVDCRGLEVKSKLCVLRLKVYDICSVGNSKRGCCYADLQTFLQALGPSPPGHQPFRALLEVTSTGCRSPS